MYEEFVFQKKMIDELINTDEKKDDATTTPKTCNKNAAKTCRNYPKLIQNDMKLIEHDWKFLRLPIEPLLWIILKFLD